MRKPRMNPAAQPEVFAIRVRRDFAPAEAAADELDRNPNPVAIASAAPEATARALRDAEEEVRRLSGLLISAHEDERRRIALDLHDGLGQILNLLKVSIDRSALLYGNLTNHEAGKCLQQLAHGVDEAITEVRRVCAQLRPAMLDDLGIVPTLAWFFREFDAVAGDRIILERIVSVAEHEIPLLLRTPVFRIVQEALNNVVKHSAADRVRIRLAHTGGALHLLIEDNGRGFEPGSVRCTIGSPRLGLVSMQERSCASGGSYQLHSAPGHGTVIRVSWPSPAAPASALRADLAMARGTRARASDAAKDTVDNV